MNLNDIYYFLMIKYCITLKSDLIWLNIWPWLMTIRQKWFYFLNKLIFTFNDSGLETQRFDKKKYNYKTRFKFELSLYPLFLQIYIYIVESPNCVMTSLSKNLLLVVHFLGIFQNFISSQNFSTEIIKQNVN